MDRKTRLRVQFKALHSPKIRSGTSTQLVAAGADNGEQDGKEEDDGTISILNEQDLADVLDTEEVSDTG